MLRVLVGQTFFVLVFMQFSSLPTDQYGGEAGVRFLGFYVGTDHWKLLPARLHYYWLVRGLSVSTAIYYSSKYSQSYKRYFLVNGEHVGFVSVLLQTG